MVDQKLQEKIAEIIAEMEGYIFASMPDGDEDKEAFRYWAEKIVSKVKDQLAIAKDHHQKQIEEIRSEIEAWLEEYRASREPSGGYEELIVSNLKAEFNKKFSWQALKGEK